MSIGKQSPRLLSVLGLLSVFAFGNFCGPAAADPIDSQGGTTILPISGLAVDLPPANGACVYKVSGSFSLNDGATYDGRDVIDEACGEILVAGTWISLGYFDAGEPAAVVAGVELTDDWTAQADFWGATWSVHGGTFTFDNDLGAQPALVACTSLSGGMSILVHHYFLSETLPMDQAAMLAAFEQASVPRAAWQAASQNRAATVYTTRRPETRNRGSIEPSRWVDLPHTGIGFQIPDDGFVWIVRAGTDEDATDFLDRMAPSLPDVSIEIAYLGSEDCESGIASITTEKRDVPPQNLPDGWSPGPQLVVGESIELTTCHATMDGVVLVGIFQGSQDTDVAYLAPMLAAISAAVGDVGDDDDW
jgi:hypothetical protein